MSVVAGVACWAVLGLVSPVWAQPLGPDAPGAAVLVYERGRELYREGRYSEAAAVFERALSLLPLSPPLAYNAARSLERAGRADEALRAYERYLALEKKGERADRAREAVAELEEVVRPGPAGPWWLVPLGGSVVTAGLATAMGLHARGLAEEASGVPSVDARLDKLDTAQGAASTATLLWVAAGVLVATSPLVAWLTAGEPQGAGATWRF